MEVLTETHRPFGVEDNLEVTIINLDETKVVETLISLHRDQLTLQGTLGGLISSHRQVEIVTEIEIEKDKDRATIKVEDLTDNHQDQMTRK